MLPAVAIVVPVSLFAMARWIRERAGIAASFSVLLLLVPLAIRVLDLVPEGRYVGGSMWFFTPVRGAMDTYDSGRPELRFAERVKAWTDRDTGVQLHTSLKHLRLEPRFDITLDRVTHRWSQNPRVEIPNHQGATGWVFVAALDAFPEEQRAAFASRHPYRQFGDYFMVDLRREARDIEAWGLTPVEATPRWWLFHSSFEPPMRATRLVARSNPSTRRSRSSMPRRQLAPMLTLWASAYLGCALFLLADLSPQDSVSTALLGQLSWLALIGSIPTTLVLGAASRAARSPRAVIAASTLAVICSGGHRLGAHRLPACGAAVDTSPAAPAGSGRDGLSVRTACRRGLALADPRARALGPTMAAAWMTLTVLAVALLMATIVRYRAYDYSMAQLVFPAGVLSGAMVYLMARGSRLGPSSWALPPHACSLDVGSRFDPALVATGQARSDGTQPSGRAGDALRAPSLPARGQLVYRRQGMPEAQTRRWSSLQSASSRTDGAT